MLADNAAAPGPNNGDSARRLLDAALSAFAEKGYHATTTRDIAQRSGMSAAAVYVHFRAKIDLLDVICKEGHEDARRRLEEAMASGSTPPARIWHGVQAFAQWHAENQTIARVVQYEYRWLPNEYRADIKVLRHRMQDDVEHEVLKGVSSGDFTAADVPSAALAIVSMCVDIARWYSRYERRTPAALGATYADIALKILGCTSTGPAQAPGHTDVAPVPRRRAKAGTQGRRVNVPDAWSLHDRP